VAGERPANAAAYRGLAAALRGQARVLAGAVAGARTSADAGGGAVTTPGDGGVLR
jgi:hypothetical protein